MEKNKSSVDKKPKSYEIKINDDFEKVKAKIKLPDGREIDYNKKIPIKTFSVTDPYGMERKFIEDKNVKIINNFHTDKYASKEALINYFSKRDNTVYEPTTEEDFKKELEKNYKKISSNRNLNNKYKYFKNGNRMYFSNNQLKDNYNNKYIYVKLKIYLDGVYVITFGRGRPYKGHLNKEQIRKEIHQATLNGIAPYGSNVHFEVIDWNFGHHQVNGTDFNIKSIKV